ncbi:hypothetical protein AYO38_05935 [bacterium SCGC AG-212-C10]|nr:hypothetical protein AYO38_05935 [bacterium SCGC AG-212-C10]
MVVTDDTMASLPTVDRHWHLGIQMANVRRNPQGADKRVAVPRTASELQRLVVLAIPVEAAYADNRSYARQFTRAAQAFKRTCQDDALSRMRGQVNG